jgi:diguanylate cyclase (GGDEF)-like protein
LINHALVTSPRSIVANPEKVLDAELDLILSERRLCPVFMPIVNGRERKILGYEALIRGPANSALYSPIELFKTAQLSGRLLELERLCRELSIRRFKLLDLQGKLFLNVSPAALLEVDFTGGMTLQLMRKLDFNPDRVVIEITEQFPIEDYQLMREATRHYREMGFQVALDDLGAGYAGLRSWSELRPQYVKIDRHFIEGLDQDRVKLEFVRSILDVARSIQCQVIAEGVERLEEHLLLNQLGLDLQQGYYFGRPNPLPPRQLSEQLFRFSHNGAEVGAQARQELTRITRIGPAIEPQTPITTAAVIFAEQPQIQSLAVTAAGLPLGLLHRQDCLHLPLFGLETQGCKPVAEFMDTQPLILEAYTLLSQISNQISNCDSRSQRSDFIVIQDGRYLGIGSIFDLLKLVTELQLKNARHASPLTQLPGRVPANEELARRLQQGQAFTLGLVDIDNFKAFNDCYGYDRGDEMIQLLVDCLRTHLDSRYDFIGHLGGDDFLLLFGSRNWRERTEQLLADFSRRVPSLYDAKEQQQGGIAGQDRSGQPLFFSMATLSIGATTHDSDACLSHQDMASLAAKSMRLAKSQPGNNLSIDSSHRPESLRERGACKALS